jgi:ATP-dependent Clp protease ATP-binding subunit ClpC
MPAHSIPILVWENHSGVFTATLVADYSNTSAVGDSATDVMRQMKEFINWAMEEESWRVDTDFLEARLTHVDVDLRPEFRVDKKIHSAPDSIRLRVPCVQGRDDSGLLLAALPTLDVRFSFNDPAALKTLVAHYVKNALQGMSPADLALRLPPKSCVLEELPARTPKIRERRGAFDRATVPTLLTVADPVIELRRGGRALGMAWERAAEVAQLVRRIDVERANVLLVGESGVGKTTIVAEAARRLSRVGTNDETSGAKDYRMWLTSAARLIAGMQFLGQWEERCETIITELAQVEGVLSVESLLELVSVGGCGPADSVAAFLLPYLQRGELRMIAEVTPAELDACRRVLPGLADVFQILAVPPFVGGRAVKVLREVAESLERGANFEVERGVPELVQRLFTRFQPYAVFPGRPVRFLRAACEQVARARGKVVSADFALDQFARETGLPEVFLRDELPLRFDEVRAELERRVLAQPRACAAAAHLVTTFKAGLNDPNRPLGVLLFCGPTGVGKTALATALADFIFGRAEGGRRLMRLDMSEFSAPWSAERLLTAPGGGPSEFIKRMRQQPFTVVLLDEIEKAAAEVFDVFLNMFDEGRLTDRLGRVTNFRSAIIVMTSNLGATASGGMGFGGETAPSYEAEVQKFFRPEFFNRLDLVVPFESLDEEAIRAITRKELDEIAGREGLTRLGLKVVWSEELVAHLSRAGFDRTFGARPLQRTIEREVIAPLAKFLLAQRRTKNATVRASWQEGAVLFHVPSAA